MIIENEKLTYNHVSFENPKKTTDFKNHSHNLCEILYFIKGDADYVIENRRYHLKKNDLVFIRPKLYHYIEILSNAEYERINASFDSSIISDDLVRRIPSDVEVINCPTDGIIKELFGRLDYYSKNLTKTDFQDVLPSILKELFYVLSINSDKSLNIPLEISPLLTKILEYVNDNLFTLKSIKDISNNFYITEQYLHKIFKTQLKTTPKKYVNSKRLIHAQKLIQRGKKPVDVFSSCGFDTYVGFYKQYINTFGYCPSKEKLTNDKNLSK
ncbi:MAG: helix-turn-helix domain-containing protein [Clostridiales bacterium]|nr:helix-turn-helix domain-containing protein [Clostridiales bacterium]